VRRITPFLLLSLAKWLDSPKKGDLQMRNTVSTCLLATVMGLYSASASAVTPFGYDSANIQAMLSSESGIWKTVHGEITMIEKAETARAHTQKYYIHTREFDQVFNHFKDCKLPVYVTNLAGDDLPWRLEVKTSNLQCVASRRSN